MTDELRARAQQALAAGDPLAPADLAEVLGVDEGTLWDLLDPVAVADDVWTPWELADTRLCDLDALLDGVVLTHRVTDQDRDAGHLVTSTNLSPAWFSVGDGVRDVRGGGTITASFDGGITLPDASLLDHAVIAVRLHPDDVEVWGEDHVPAPDERLGHLLDAARHTVELHRSHRAEPTLAVIEALALDPDAFASPRAPLTELFASADLRVTDGDWLVPTDEPDGTFAVDLDEYDLDAFLEHLEVGHGLTEAQAEAVVQLGDQITTAGMPFLETLSAQVDLLVDGEASFDDVGATLVQEAGLDDPDGLVGLLQRRALDDEDLGGLLKQVLASMPATAAFDHDIVADDHLLAMLMSSVLQVLRLSDRRHRANAEWLSGRCAELVAEDHREAEHHFQRAVELDRNHGEALYALADYAAARGRAGAALGLLRQLEDSGGDPELYELLLQYEQPGPRTAGRNDPCPCGSGRKHKVCCATTNGWSLQDRVPWVWSKVVSHLFTPAGWEKVAMLLDEPDLLEDPIVRAVVLHEGGGIDAYLAARGPLLPPDELALLRDYADVRASALLVVDMDPGVGLDVRDQHTGDLTYLPDVRLSHAMAVDELALGWILPGPDGPEPAGALLTVPEHTTSSLLALLDDSPDAGQLLDWLIELETPPELRNRAGEELTLTTFVWEVADVDATEAVLDDAFDHDGDDGFLIVEELADGEEVPAGHLRLVDGELHGEANSTRRADELQVLVAALLPDAVLVDTTTHSAEELRALLADLDLGADVDED